MVRATLQDLDIVEQKIAVLNTPPPQVNIKCMFVEIPRMILRLWASTGIWATC
jgi:hypothetical protein